MGAMLDSTSEYFRKIQQISDLLMVSSEEGYSGFDEDECLLLSGIVRDCAYRLRDAVEMGRKSLATRDYDGGRKETRYEGT